MPTPDAIAWFKTTLGPDIAPALQETPFDLDMLVALACQETGQHWNTLRKTGLSRDEILALCVGDTLDEDKGRRAFPRTRAALLAVPRGQEMFGVARAALVEMAKHVNGFSGVAKNPNKFCHGFGLFQYDLQFFKVEPEYFLDRRYERLADTLARALRELHTAAGRAGHGGKPRLSDLEFAQTAIAYNTGGFKPSKGLRQGHHNGQRFYGEAIFDFLALSRSVNAGPAPATVQPAAPGEATLPAPTAIVATGRAFTVDTRIDPLRLRSAPEISDPREKNVVANLPDGHPVRAVDDTVVNGFRAIETSLMGANLSGFASADNLKPAPASTPIPVVEPAAAPPQDGPPAVLMPRKAGHVTRRTGIAGAHSLNEPNQPGRRGETPARLIAELDAIIDWLAVEDAAHLRYKPRDGLTFCNIYAHDYCHLAGAYLPRVFWTGKALVAIGQGKKVEPDISATIQEMRANGLFHWLRSFGADFGWRQTGTLTKLQQAANQGGIALLVALRKNEGKPGHIVAIAPEGDAGRARRDAAGEVIAPLQSQAGAQNFRRGAGKTSWWTGSQFNDFAFWIHP